MKLLSFSALFALALTQTALASQPTVEKVTALSDADERVSLGLIEEASSVYGQDQGQGDANAKLVTTYCGGVVSPFCINAVIYDPEMIEGGDAGTWETFQVKFGTGAGPKNAKIKRVSKSLISLEFETYVNDPSTEPYRTYRQKVIANFTVTANGQIAKQAVVKTFPMSNE